MKTPTICALALGSFALHTASADTFGSGANTFTIDFVDIGNPGNADDATGSSYSLDGGLYGSGTASGLYGLYGPTFGLGGVPYNYRMGVTEVAEDWITKATNLGMTNVTAGAWTGLKPAATMSWYEAAAFVNFLNTSNGYQAAYNLSFSGSWSMMLWSSAQAWQAGGENLYRHKDAYYFLPSENEWYKAAYHQNDGVTASYRDYPTASNSIPTEVASGTTSGTAVYNGVTILPAAVDNAGGLSAYGTRGQGGNVWEWQESAADGISNSSSEDRALRGGDWFNPEAALRSSGRGYFLDPSVEANSVGFRVASVPEPSSAVLMLGSGLLWLARRRRERAV